MGMTLGKILNVECSTYDFKESVEKTEELQRERMETLEKNRSISHKR